MVFSRIEFLYLFLPLLLLAFFVIKNLNWRRGVLLTFSLLFYAWGKPIHILVMLFLVGADYLFGRLIGSERATQKSKKVWLIIAIITNIATLCLFKYVGFVTENINLIFNLSLPIFSPEMPIGISFFTFQTMSYVIDVYRGDARVQKSFPRLLLYVSFFPQLIAGPIVRYKDIDYQLDNPDISIENVCDGAFRFAIGLGKKVLIADRCAKVISSLLALSSPTLLSVWGVSIFFTFQLYFDFSGYSDMALGLGKIFGFKFLENFNYPLISSSATDFWRRWHISLGSFFRDYVYIPLGGKYRHQYLNILIVWFLTGLWHGASWNFVLWGLYYAILLTIEKTLLKGFLSSKIGKVVGHIITPIITIIGFSIFYYEENLFANLGRLFGAGISALTDIYTNSILLGNIYLLIVAIIFALPTVPKLISLFKNKDLYLLKRVGHTLITLLILLFATVKLVGNTYSPFLYFRF